MYQINQQACQSVTGAMSAYHSAEGSYLTLYEGDSYFAEKMQMSFTSEGIFGADGKLVQAMLPGNYTFGDYSVEIGVFQGFSTSFDVDITPNVY